MFEEWLHACAISVSIPWGGPRFFDELTILTLCMLGIFMLLLSSTIFFKVNFFQMLLSGTLSECQLVLIQIKTDVLSVLIWVQIVFKGYRQTTKVAASKLRFNRQNTLRIATVQII